ncbi:hypothetical protein GHT06_003589 [Daphnia sinensis]|uniref:NADP transhydrogenase beta-like domain-containing protein n=1 Tax=Daphnia sinensis TaxID=1820382 RepID=A0AAD5PL70_9CRUS|nr:hypothetical protein GHT06_003589 [Daphnia sinensis]
MTIAIQIAYLIASILFIAGIKLLSKTKDARRGNILSSVGMIIAILATLVTIETVSLIEIFVCILIGGAIGLYYAYKVEMTKIPEMVALFNGFGGLASFGVALSDHFLKTQVEAVEMGPVNSISIILSVLIGGDVYGFHGGMAQTKWKGFGFTNHI